MHFGFLSLYALQVYQPPAPVVGVAVGLAAGTVGVGVAPVVGSAVGLGTAGIGVGVTPAFVVGTTVGLVVGTVGVVGVPTAGVVPTPVVWAGSRCARIAAIGSSRRRRQSSGSYHSIAIHGQCDRILDIQQADTIQATSPKRRIEAVCQEGKERVSDGWHRRGRVLRQPHFLLQDWYSSVYQILAVDRCIG